MSASGVILQLSGAVDEHTQFEQLVTKAGKLQTELEVRAKSVPRITSAGVKNWIRFFKSLQTRGVKVRFNELSPALVEQLNVIRNFAAGGTVESIYLPFSCVDCRTELMALYRVEELKQGATEFPALPCTNCGAEATFDDAPEIYLAFARGGR